MKSITLFFFLLITGLSLRAETAYEFVDKLYSNPNSDLHYPTKAALKLYGSELQGLIQKAIDIRMGHEKKYPGDKPPFADYSLTSPSMEAYETYKIFTAKSGESKHHLVIVQLLYSPKDKVEPDFVFFYLQQDKGDWHIQNIRHQSYRYDLKEFQTNILTQKLKEDIKKPW